MSRFLKTFAPRGLGVAGALALTYMLASQFDSEIPVRVHGHIVAVANAEASTAGTMVAATAGPVPVAAMPAPLAPDGGYGLGREAHSDEVAAWDIDVRSDGQGLPAGRGDVATGEEVFAEKCASCHGDFGEAVGRWPVLAGGFDTLTSERPVKTIGSYWPYLSTVYDYVNRAMPFGDARSLTSDDVYAITAYLLFLNDQVDEDFELSHENFVKIKLPNEASFYLDDRAETEIGDFSAEPCMENCKPSVEITMRARVLDVTPENSDEAVEAAATVATDETAAVTDIASAPTAVDPALIESGKSAFRACKACHQVGDRARNRAGPQLNSLFGRVAGGVGGFRYSKAFKAKKEEGLVWDDETLTAFLEAPRRYIKGTKMSFKGLSKPEEIAGLLEYLRTFSE